MNCFIKKNKWFKKFAGKKFFILSLCVVGYMCSLFMNAYVFKSDFVLFGFFYELLNFPLIFLGQPALLVISVFYCIKDKFRIKSYSFWSFIILLISNVFVFGSFYYPSLFKF